MYVSKCISVKVQVCFAVALTPSVHPVHGAHSVSGVRPAVCVPVYTAWRDNSGLLPSKAVGGRGQKSQ